MLKKVLRGIYEVTMGITVAITFALLICIAVFMDGHDTLNVIAKVFSVVGACCVALLGYTVYRTYEMKNREEETKEEAE